MSGFKRDEETFPESNPYAWTENSNISISDFVTKVGWLSSPISSFRAVAPITDELLGDIVQTVDGGERWDQAGALQSTPLPIALLTNISPIHSGFGFGCLAQVPKTPHSRSKSKH
jgi:hypothetical protein